MGGRAISLGILPDQLGGLLKRWFCKKQREGQGKARTVLRGRLAAHWVVCRTGLCLQSLTWCLSTDIVQMHIETLDAVHRESKRLPPIQKVGTWPAAVEGKVLVLYGAIKSPSTVCMGLNFLLYIPVAKAAAPQPVGG